MKRAIGPISVSRAIWLGTLWVNLPVLALLCAPLWLFGQLFDRGLLPDHSKWMVLPVFAASFVLAWLWWAVMVPRWRLWAYRRVRDIAALKARAVSAGLTWPDGHFFSRSEIKSRRHAELERELEIDATGPSP
ncbi:hypothetical protein [Methyloversatilis thermotolerans]|uniref:hypothetical protein n=1 Tax=Methyloversatilis thermotolerans TaxID=1346290 RepID=UPI0003652A95|nr:hypothetical protein [Methyloversatilis thermotolerans]